jgi:nitrous oxide reductase
MSRENKKNEMTRRDFLETAAKGAGAMALVVFGGGFAFVSANTVSSP